MDINPENFKLALSSFDSAKNELFLARQNFHFAE